MTIDSVDQLQTPPSLDILNALLFHSITFCFVLFVYMMNDLQMLCIVSCCFLELQLLSYVRSIALSVCCLSLHDVWYSSCPMFVVLYQLNVVWYDGMLS